MMRQPLQIVVVPLGEIDKFGRIFLADQNLNKCE